MGDNEAKNTQFFEIETALRVAHVSGIWAIDFVDGLSSLHEVQARIELSKLGASKLHEIPTSKAADFVSVQPSAQGKVVHADLSGAMRLNDGMCSVGAVSFGKELMQAAQGSDVAGVVLNIRSGGGEAQAGVHLAQVITDIRKSGKKVVSLVDRAGSAAYMVAAASDGVVMNGDMSQAGSIGALISIDKGFAEAYKAYVQDIYAEQSTDKNKSFRDFVEKGDASGLKADVSQLAQMFINQVTTQRGIEGNAQLNSTMSGGMFYAQDAITRGLADKVGTMTDAINYIFSQEQAESVTPFAPDNTDKMSIISKLFGSLALAANTDTQEIDEAKASKVVADAQKEVDTLQSKLDEQANEIVSMSATLASAIERAESAEAKTKEANDIVVSLTDNATTYQIEIASLKNVITEMAAQATELPKGVSGQRVGQANASVNAGLQAQNPKSRGTVQTERRIF